MFSFSKAGLRAWLRAVVALVPASLSSQSLGPALRVDVSAGRQPISPYIYGINDYSDWQQPELSRDLARAMGVGVSRWGGNHTSRYNWLTDTYNSANDWFWENQPYGDSEGKPLPESSRFNRLVEDYTAVNTNLLATVPMLGWMPRRDRSCGFDIGKYGPQQHVDQWRPNCGNGVKPDGRTPVTGNDPRDTSDQVDERHIQDWIRHLVARYGTAEQGGIPFYALDNEPVWWSSSHRDIHPASQTYDETLQLGVTYGQAVKQVDPAALVFGPATAGWWDLWMSHKDLMAGWTSRAPWKWYLNPIDQQAHGGLPFIPWYLLQMAQFEREHGYRLLDVLDVHAYILPSGLAFEPAGDAAKQALRLESTRVFWDASYRMPDPNDDFYFQPVRLIPRLREWIAQYYSGTKIAITEYNWGAIDHINGALAQADILGIFGREGVYMANIWGPPSVEQPAAFAFRIYLDYDGRGSRFGETAVKAESDDQGKLAVYAAERSDKTVTVAVINKTAAPLTSTLDISGGFQGEGRVELYQYSSADLTQIVREEDAAITDGQVTAKFPASSITMMAIPTVAHMYSVPQPVVNAVVNAASYENAIAPGQMVAIFGSNLGPESAVIYPSLRNLYLVDTQLAGVRVLFNGVPGAMIAATPGQVNCVVPYASALRGRVWVRVEREGRRSEGFEIQLAPAAPGLFTVNQSGQGQGAILNNYAGGITRLNSPQDPATRGMVVSVYLTGEGLTDPPGVDGRLATVEAGRLQRFPRPVLPVTATIGRQRAEVQYAGGAPGNMAGLCQANVKVPENSPAGIQPIEIRIGDHRSQPGVTLVVQ
jgi:uncharacterized protein (TIGR03437 family)